MFRAEESSSSSYRSATAVPSSVTAVSIVWAWAGVVSSGRSRPGVPARRPGIGVGRGGLQGGTGGKAVGYGVEAAGHVGLGYCHDG